MDKNNVPICIVTSFSPSLGRNCHKILLRLGYNRSISLIRDNLDQKNLAGSYKVCVLPLERESARREKTASVIEQLKTLPILGVVRSSEDQLNSDVLDLCNDFLYWPCKNSEFAMRIEQLYKKYSPTSTPSDADKLIDQFVDLNMIGRSPAFLQVLRQIKQISACDAPVLIEGPTGTGKEMAARAIHYHSARCDYPFIPVNCGAIPDNLLENELFGHEKGAYTDAKLSQQGLIQQADKGTIFLDEVDAFSPKGQVVLLRFLQDLLFKPLGGEKYRQSNVRIIAASNKGLGDLVNRDEFRQDLFYRLNIMSIQMPPLCHRTGDIKLLAEHFLNQYKLQYDQPQKALHPDTYEFLNHYRWPGNIRELENLIHREFLMAAGPMIKIGQDRHPQIDRCTDLTDRKQTFLFEQPFNEAKSYMVDQFEKKYLAGLIRKAEGNVTLAAKLAGKERRALGKLLKKHGITKEGQITG